MDNLLKEVTYKTVKNFKSQEVILPGDYSKTFGIFAKELGLDVNNKEVILDGISQDSDKIDKIVKETNNNLTALSHSAKNAQTAIVNKDTQSLENIQSDVCSLQERIQFLQEELFTDALTKAKNRKWFCDFYLKDDTFPNNGYLAFIDLNDFKYINDTHGHIIGDQVLKYLAAFLKKELPLDNIDIIRYAGDEFMVIFDNINDRQKKLEEKMDSVQSKLAKQVLKSRTIKELKFAFSYGLTPYKTNDDFNEIIEIADELMYKNKKKVKGLK